MPRRVTSNTTTTGVRDALIAEQQRFYERWPSERLSDFILDLQAHCPVRLSAAKLEALLAGARFGSGSDDEFFLLDERDQLLEVGDELAGA